ncbi:MAG: LytR C-terminal domain-containing protein [bacterium]|nr:LytR C-terminal domain-containing protein [bacterium]
MSLGVLAFVGSFVINIMKGESAPAPDSAEAIVPMALRVQILNGCGIAGAASTFSRHVKTNAGPDFIVDVLDEGNFESFQQEKTLLIARKAKHDHAARFAAKIGLSPDRISFKELESNFYDIDYSLVVGADYEKLIALKKPN